MSSPTAATIANYDSYLYRHHLFGGGGGETSDDNLHNNNNNIDDKALIHQKLFSPHLFATAASAASDASATKDTLASSKIAPKYKLNNSSPSSTAASCKMTFRCVPSGTYDATSQWVSRSFNYLSHLLQQNCLCIIVSSSSAAVNTF